LAECQRSLAECQRIPIRCPGQLLLAVYESRYAVLDSFFWRSKTDQMGIQCGESFPPPDPRLDRDMLQARGETLGPMPREALWAPVRLRMQRKADWQEEVNRSLTLSAPEADQLVELERTKRIMLDCARAVLGLAGGRLWRITIPHHSKEAKLLVARRSSLPRVVLLREIHTRKELDGDSVPPSRAMRKVWDSGLQPQPADLSILGGLWQAQNQAWAADWLPVHMRWQSASTRDEWHQLRRSELTAAAGQWLTAREA
jgi:hypothetical protein